MANSDDWRENYEEGKKDGHFGESARSRELEWNSDYIRGRTEAVEEIKEAEAKRRAPGH